MDGSPLGDAFNCLPGQSKHHVKYAVLDLLWRQKTIDRPRQATKPRNTTEDFGMTSAAVRIGVGTRLVHDGELVEIVEVRTCQTGMDVVLKTTSTQTFIRAHLNDILMSDSARVIPDSEGPCSDDDFELAGVVLSQVSDAERKEVIERAAHVREVLTGFRSGSEELALAGELRPEISTRRAPIEALRVQGARASCWTAIHRALGSAVPEVGEAGQVSRRDKRPAVLGVKVDPRWVETTVEVMVGHTDQSRPPQRMVITRTNARVVGRSGEGVVVVLSSLVMRPAGSVGGRCRRAWYGWCPRGCRRANCVG